nr:hypothetical protein [Gemmatimonadaceae bacterium]
DYEARVGITLKLYDIGTRTVIATTSFTVDNHFCPLPFCPTNDATPEEAIAAAMKALRKPMLAFFTTAIPPRVVTLNWAPDSSTISAVKLNAGKSSGLRRGHRFEIVTTRPSALDPDEVERVKLGLLEVADEDPMSASANVVSGGNELARFFQQVIRERDPKKRPVYTLQAAGKK